MKHSVESYLPFLINAANLAIYECELPDKLKKSEEIPLHEKQDPLKKKRTTAPLAYYHMYQGFLSVSSTHITITAQKVSVVGVILSRIFPAFSRFGLNMER